VTNVAVIGCGYWGPNLVRVLGGIDGTTVRTICDLDPERLATLQRRYPALRTVTEAETVFADPEIEAVAICTPVQTHYPLARAALEAGKHVLVEKPLAHSVAAAERLVRLAEDRGLTLHVDHTFVYTGAVRKIRALVDAGELGDLLYLDSVRVNLGLFQSDVNVLWDLAPHDVSIITHLVDRAPRWVSAIGAAHYGRTENQAYVTIKFDGSLLAHVHVNWLAPVKVRSTLIGGSKRMIVYDDLEPSEKIRVYEKGVTLHSDPASRARVLVDYRTGDMSAPYIDKTEPLERSCRTFLEAIETRTPSPTDGRAGLAVVRILEAAEESMQSDGKRVPLTVTAP
jgi:predicted dehydrogenase